MTYSGGNVVVVHDYVTQRGGAERVTLELLRAFPGARLVTSCWDRAAGFPDFHDFEIETLWLDRVDAIRRDPRRAFPLLARAFRQHIITDADVVICSSSGWSHRVFSTAPKIVYCHNPARWLYQPDDYFGDRSPAAKRAFAVATSGLRASDYAAAHRASRYVANSSVVARRIADTYDIDATVIAPSRGLSPDGLQEPIIGLEPGFLMTVSRSRGYKNTDVVCDAVASLPTERLVVIGRAAPPKSPANVTHLANVTDAQLRWLYANAKGLVAVAFEDFGLTAVEAQAFGLPSVLLRSGGYLDSTVEGVTGVFVDEISPFAVAAGIQRLSRRSWDASRIRHWGERYTSAAFAEQMRSVVDDVLTGTVTADADFAERTA